MTQGTEISNLERFRLFNFRKSSSKIEDTQCLRKLSVYDKELPGLPDRSCDTSQDRAF